MYNSQLPQEPLIFAHLTEQQKTTLALARVKKSFATDKELFAEGETANYFYQLESGVISLYRLSPEGDEKLFQQVKAGEMLAESAVLMSPAVYPVNAKVSEAATVWCYPRKVLVELCAQNNEFALQLISSLANRLHQAVNRIDQLTLKNAGQRLVAYLLEQKKIQSTDWLTLPVSHGQLARQLNITPETLSRLFKKFKQQEMLSINKQTIVLLDIESLCETVNLPYFSSDKTPSPSLQGCVTGCCNIFTKWF